MKPVTLLAVLVVGGILAAFGLARKGPAVKEEDAGLLGEVDLQGEGSQIKLLEGQVEYLEGQVRVLREENSALLEQLGRLGMKEGGGKMTPGGVGEVEPDFVGMGLDLVKLRELEALPTAALPVPGEVIEEKIMKWLRARQPGDRGERQGQALHVQTATRDLLFDTGPDFDGAADAGNRILTPYLRAVGVRRFDRLIVSHDDIDHDGGTASLLASVPVERVERRCVAGEAWEWDGVRFLVLHPAAADYVRALPDNALSCVLKIESVHGAALISGDIEQCRPKAPALRSAKKRSSVSRTVRKASSSQGISSSVNRRASMVS